MRTLIVSDLHLGSASRVDILRRPGPRAALLEAMRDVQRLVLLGDVLELRHGPRHEALAAARAFFEDVGRAMAGREIVVLAGNHDHALVEPWLERRGERTAPAPLDVEQHFAAPEASPMLAQLAAWAAPARVSVAYPGLWVRDDVYATHGHYLDCHLTVPTMERLGIGAMGRVLRRPVREFTGPDDYEAVTNPVFAWIDAIARQAKTGDALNGGLTVRAWRALNGVEDTAGTAVEGAAPGPRERSGLDGSTHLRAISIHAESVSAASVRSVSIRAMSVRASPSGLSGLGRQAAQAGLAQMSRTLRKRALSGAFPLAVAALNRAGFGPFNADLSGGELRRAGLRAMGEVAARLGLDGAYVVFGHTHRAGPLPGDREPEWVGAGGARLVNCGCWTYDSYFLTETPGESPYWPGCAVFVDEEGAPRVLRLLQGRGHDELAPARDATSTSSVPAADRSVSGPRGSLPA